MIVLSRDPASRSRIPLRISLHLNDASARADFAVAPGSRELPLRRGRSRPAGDGERDRVGFGNGMGSVYRVANPGQMVLASRSRPVSDDEIGPPPASLVWLDPGRARRSGRPGRTSVARLDPSCRPREVDDSRADGATRIEPRGRHRPPRPEDPAPAAPVAIGFGFVSQIGALSDSIGLWGEVGRGSGVVRVSRRCAVP